MSLEIFLDRKSQDYEIVTFHPTSNILIYQVPREILRIDNEQLSPSKREQIGQKKKKYIKDLFILAKAYKPNLLFHEELRNLGITSTLKRDKIAQRVEFAQHYNYENDRNNRHILRLLENERNQGTVMAPFEVSKSLSVKGYGLGQIDCEGKLTEGFSKSYQEFVHDSEELSYSKNKGLIVSSEANIEMILNSLPEVEFVSFEYIEHGIDYRFSKKRNLLDITGIPIRQNSKVGYTHLKFKE